MMKRRIAVWLGILAVGISIAGASLVTYAVLPPHRQTSVAFAGFCWLVAMTTIIRMIWVVKNSPANKDEI